VTTVIPEKPWSHILADFIIKLLLVQEYNAILVVYNWFSKMVYFIATMEKTLVERLARLFKNYVWKLYGLLKSITLDRRVQFMAEIIKELIELLEIQTKLSMAYYL